MKIFCVFLATFQHQAYVFNNIKVKHVPESQKFQLHFSDKGTATVFTPSPQDITIEKNAGSTAPTPHKIIKDTVIEPQPWKTTRAPEIIETKQVHDLAHTQFDKSAGLKERDQKGEFIEVDPSVVLRMIQELKRYQQAKKSIPDSLEKELIKKRQSDKLRDKMDMETLERQQKIQKLKQKILALKEKIEEQSAMQLTDKIIDDIEKERQQLVKMLNELKGIEEEDVEEQKQPDSFFDQFLEDQSVLLEQLEKRIEQEKKKLEDAKKQIEYMQKEIGTQSEEFKELLKKKFILENLIKDLLQQKIDILKKIKLEKEKQEKMEQIQKEEEEIQKKIQEIAEQRKKEAEGKEEKKDSDQEALEEIENIMNEVDETEVEQEEAEKHKKQEQVIEDKQQQVNEEREELKDKEEEINKQENIVINDGKIIEKDEAQEEMNDGLHDELIEDAEAQKEKLKKINEQIKENIRQKEEMEQKLQDRLKSKVPLKHQLDITLNPFYHILQGVLDKDFANTQNFEDYQPTAQDGKGPVQLKKISANLIEIQNYFDHLFGDIPATPEEIPKNTESKVENALVIMDQSVKFVREFEVVQEQINLNIEQAKFILQNIETDPNEALEFYDLTDEYFLAMQKAKEVQLEPVNEIKDKIQEELESFDTQAQQLEFKLEDLENYEKKLQTLIQKLQAKVNLNEIELKNKDDKREFYKTERLKQLDDVMKIIPLFVEVKMSIDSDISDANQVLMEIQRNKSQIQKLIKDIDIEIQKDKLMKELELKGEDTTTPENLVENLLHSETSIKMIFYMIFLLFQLQFLENYFKFFSINNSKMAKSKSQKNQRKTQHIRREERADLLFPIGRIARYLREGNYAPQYSEKAAIAMAATLEYITEELLLLAHDHIRDKKAVYIQPKHIRDAIRDDEEFKNFLEDRMNVLIHVYKPKVKKQEKEENEPTQLKQFMKIQQMIFLKKKSIDYQCFFLELLCEYLKAEQYTDLQVVYLSENHQKFLNVEIVPQMLDSKNNSHVALTKITQTLLQEMNLDMDLMGYQDDEIQQCMSYFEMVHSYTDNVEQLLTALESELQGSTFLSGRMNLGVPDLLVFAFLYRKFLDLENDEKREFAGLYRWFNYMQNLRGIKNFLEKRNYPLMKEIDWTVEEKKGGKKKKVQKK